MAGISLEKRHTALAMLDISMYPFIVYAIGMIWINGDDFIINNSLLCQQKSAV